MFDQQWLHSECEKLRLHQTLEQFYLHLKWFAQQLGYLQIIYSVQPSFNNNDQNVPPPIMLTTYDGDWLDYYLNRTYTQQDAILEYCLSDNGKPYQFKASTSLYGVTESDIQGMKSKGYSENGVGALSVIVLASKDKASPLTHDKDTCKKLIEHFAYCFNSEILKKFPGKFSPSDSPNLTPREREVILWLASGLGYEQIAGRLDVGMSTVRKHVASVIKKLNARNSAHACALAVRFGLIH